MGKRRSGWFAIVDRDERTDMAASWDCASRELEMEKRRSICSSGLALTTVIEYVTTLVRRKIAHHMDSGLVLRFEPSHADTRRFLVAADKLCLHGAAPLLLKTSYKSSAYILNFNFTFQHIKSCLRQVNNFYAFIGCLDVRSVLLPWLYIPPSAI